MRMAKSHFTITEASVRIHLAQLNGGKLFGDVMPLRNTYVAKFDDPITDGCQLTKDFLT